MLLLPRVKLTYDILVALETTYLDTMLQWRRTRVSSRTSRIEIVIVEELEMGLAVRVGVGVWVLHTRREHDVQLTIVGIDAHGTRGRTVKNRQTRHTLGNTRSRLLILRIKARRTVLPIAQNPT